MNPSIGTNTGRSEPFTTEHNDECYKRLISGDANARNEMIEGNIALAVYRTDAYLRTSPQMAYYRDDMISAGLVGLCEAIDTMQKKGAIRNPKPTGYIARTIDQHIVRLADEANTIVVSYKAQERARAEGKPILPPRLVSDKVLLGVDDSVFRDRNATKELQDEILACCHNAIERQIVMMRSEGYTDAQIGDVLNLSDTTISSRRKAIHSRLLERCPEFRETKRALAKKAAKKAAREAKKKAKA
jgi:DNA-directed RNA polymerase specialized sigma subunit